MSLFLKETKVLESQMQTMEDDFYYLDIGEYQKQNHKFFVGRGFGYTRNEEGYPIYRYHFHKVKLHLMAHIGNGTNIDIGRDRDTVIDEFTMIDSLVHIGHSAIIGRKCIIVSGAVIGGHVEIDDGCYIGPNVFIKQGIKIGKGVFIGPQSYVTKDIPDGEAWFGVPAKRHKEIENNEYVKRSTWRQ